MRYPKLFLLAVAFLMLSTNYVPTSGYVPIFMSRDEMEKAVKLDAPRPMYETGKLYYKAPYLYIIEKYKGVHIIDNTDPSNPEKISFLHIDGIRDIAIKNDVLYADNAVDLIAVQFNESLTSVNVSKRIKNFFPEMESPDGWGLSYSIRKSRPDNSIIVGWKIR